MTMRKYQKAEGFAHLSKQEHEQVDDELRKVGKHSMAELDDQERKQVTDAIDADSWNDGTLGYKP